MTNLSEVYDVVNNIRGKGKNFCRPTVGQFFKSDRGYDETDNWCDPVTENIGLRGDTIFTLKYGVSTLLNMKGT